MLDVLCKWLVVWSLKESLYVVFLVLFLENLLIDFVVIMYEGIIWFGVVFNWGLFMDGKEVIGFLNVFYCKSWCYGVFYDLLVCYFYWVICSYELDSVLLLVYWQFGFQEVGVMSVWLKIQKFCCYFLK